MGILHKLVFILGKLDRRNKKWKNRILAIWTAKTSDKETAHESQCRGHFRGDDRSLQLWLGTRKVVDTSYPAFAFPSRKLISSGEHDGAK
jgi:hypothetical protein